jgi:hypothetical protein
MQLRLILVSTQSIISCMKKYYLYFFICEKYYGTSYLRLIPVSSLQSVSFSKIATARRGRENGRITSNAVLPNLCKCHNDTHNHHVLAPAQQETMSNRRVTRLGAIRTLTCLEAVEEGYSFVKRCSGCDYYHQNHQTNAIALKKPRSELSKYWRCTTPHTYGELASSDLNTPYQPIKPTKYNSYLVSNRRLSNDHSSTKRVRLFSPPYSNNDASQAPDPQISFADYSKCLAERDIAFAERDSAITRMDEISAESARECEAARKEVVSAKAKRHEVTIERDLAAQERDFLEAENIRHLNMISRLESEILLLRNEVANLKEKQRTTEELLPVYVERQSRLTERVSALELQQRKDQSKSYVFVGSKKSPLLYLKNFTKKLYPELDHKAQLVSLFEEMYAKKNRSALM